MDSGQSEAAADPLSAVPGERRAQTGKTLEGGCVVPKFKCLFFTTESIFIYLR